MALKVLYAEDNETLREHLTEAMAGMGHTVDAVGDGSRLLEHLESGKTYDVIVTDNQMPKVRGIEALRQIRGQERFKKIPVIVLSSDKIGDEVRKLEGVFLNKGIEEQNINALQGCLDLIELLALRSTP